MSNITFYKLQEYCYKILSDGKSTDEILVELSDNDYKKLLNETTYPYTYKTDHGFKQIVISTTLGNIVVKNSDKTFVGLKKEKQFHDELNDIIEKGEADV